MDRIVKTTYTSLAIIILLGLHSCTENLTETFSETEIITQNVSERNFVTLRSNGEQSTLNGYYFNCQLDDGSILNVLAYGEDLTIDEDEAFFTEPLFIQYWSTPENLKTGIYLAEGGIIDPRTNNELQRFFEIAVENNPENPEIISGSFKTVNYTGFDTMPEINGSFRVSALPCEVLTASGDLEDFQVGLSGRATIDGETFFASNGFCQNAFLEQEFPTSIFFIGGVQELTNDNEVVIDEFIEYIIFTELLEEFDSETIYSATIINDVAEFFELTNNGITVTDAKALGDPISISYSEITGTFTRGIILNEQDEIIGEFNASQFNCF